jgi:hypothetical protein
MFSVLVGSRVNYSDRRVEGGSRAEGFYAYY